MVPLQVSKRRANSYFLVRHRRRRQTLHLFQRRVIGRLIVHLSVPRSVHSEFAVRQRLRHFHRRLVQMHRPDWIRRCSRPWAARQRFLEEMNPRAIRHRSRLQILSNSFVRFLRTRHTIRRWHSFRCHCTDHRRCLMRLRSVTIRPTRSRHLTHHRTHHLTRRLMHRLTRHLMHRLTRHLMHHLTRHLTHRLTRHLTHRPTRHLTHLPRFAPRFAPHSLGARTRGWFRSVESTQQPRWPAFERHVQVRPCAEFAYRLPESQVVLQAVAQLQSRRADSDTRRAWT